MKSIIQAAFAVCSRLPGTGAVAGPSGIKMVEMRGVEPLSEDLSAELSPSAFHDLSSPARPFMEKLPEG